jgi:peptidoglycan/LPS O-acetylase OafA/YrhL
MTTGPLPPHHTPFPAGTVEPEEGRGALSTTLEMDFGQAKVPTIHWLTPLRGLALLGIFMVHLVELLGPGAWFTNPRYPWPDLNERLSMLWPAAEGSILPSWVIFLGWLGDAMPGVFILLSGVGLAWSGLHRPRPARMFYRRRLLRLYPAYVVLHVAFLGFALVIPGSSVTMNAPATLLSMLGIRASDALFFYINPSWWFVWTIIQLYLVFPPLMHLLQRLGVWRFLAVTVGFSLACRAFGIFYWEYIPNDLYVWLTGSFFGTRLAEFVVGMAAAYLIARGKLNKPAALRALLVALPIYALGLAASLTWIGAIANNLLVSMGATGALYALWSGIICRNKALQRATDYMGQWSYGAYLYHQVPLMTVVLLFDGMPAVQLGLGLAILATAFHVGQLVERTTDWIVDRLRSLAAKRWLRWLSLALSLGSIGAMFLQGLLQFDGRAFWWVFGVVFIVLGRIEYRPPAEEHWTLRGLRWMALVLLLLRVFLFTPGYAKILALVLAFATASLALLLWRMMARRRVRAWLFAAGTMIVAMAAIEWGLWRFAPVESGSWGEAPALRVHPTRHYGLHPNADIHLRYNNYDFHVRTNSEGLASPQIADARPTPDTFRVLVLGDAFSMPEGHDTEQGYAAQLEKALRDRLAPREVR